jgi:hypothetical protein
LCEKGERRVDVIGRTSDAIAFAAGIAGHGGKIGVECGSYCGTKDRRTVAGAEDDMDKKTGERLRHGGRGKSGLQPSQLSLGPPKTQADGLGWNDGAPSVLVCAPDICIIPAPLDVPRQAS